MSPSRRPFESPVVVAALLAWVGLGAFLPGSFGAWGRFPLLGVLPGLALATWLPLERNALARWTLGVAASPLVTGIAAWLLMRAGLSLPVAARVVAATALAGWLLGEWRRARSGADAADPGDGMRFAWGWALGAAAIVGFVLFANPYLQVRADGWIHGGIVWEILERGIPPQDPRFAGLTLNYVWAFNYFIALLTSLGPRDPFAYMAVSNAASMFATMALAWLIARRVWDSPRAAAGAALLMGLAFNAGVYLLWPLRLLQALTGHEHGGEALARIVASGRWDKATVIFDLNPPYTYMVNFLDKPLHGTAINMAYVFMLVFLWGVVGVVGALRGSGGPALFWVAAAASGMHFFHGVVGLSVVPVSLAALAAAWLLAGWHAWLPPRGRLVTIAAATVAGSLFAAPYTITIARAWPASQSGLRHSYLAFDPIQWLTLATSLAVAAWFARGSIRRLVAEQRGTAALVALYVAGMVAFSLVVTLPIGSHAKFLFQAFAGLAVLGGVAFHDEMATWRRRLGRAGAALLFALVLAGMPALTLRGYLLDRSEVLEPEHPMVPGERELYAWVRTATPLDAVFVDRGFRDVIMVEGRRQLLLGSRRGPEQAAFPLQAILQRRAAMADLYEDSDSLGRAVALLEGLGRPAYVVVRAGDADSARTARARLEQRSGRFGRVYDRDGFLVYHLAPESAGPSSAGYPPSSSGTTQP